MEVGGVVSIFLSCGLCISIIFNIVQYYKSRKMNEKIILLRCSANQKIIENQINNCQENNQIPDIENQINNCQENKSDDEMSSSSIIMLEESDNGDDIIFNIEKKNEIKMMISGDDL